MIGGEREIMSKVINIAKKTAESTIAMTGIVTAAAAATSPIIIGAEIASNAILHTGVKPSTVVKNTAVAAVSTIASAAVTSAFVYGVCHTINEIRSSKNEVNNNFNDDDLDEVVEVDEVVEEEQTEE